MLVHFAADTEAVFMTTRLAGTATYFLPFNRGYEGGAGNPPGPKGRVYRTAYLWEEVLQRDSLLDLLAWFIHVQIEEKRDDRGRKVKKEIGEAVDPARMYEIKSELDADGVYGTADVESFSAVYFKPRQRQSPNDHQLTNAALDPGVSRFRGLQNSKPDEAELWRGKMLAFCSL